MVKLPLVREKRAPVIRGEREPRVREDVEPGAGLPNTARTGGSTELTEVGGGWRVASARHRRALSASCSIIERGRDARRDLLIPAAAWRRHRAKGLCKRRKSGPK